MVPSRGCQVLDILRPGVAPGVARRRGLDSPKGRLEGIFLSIRTQFFIQIPDRHKIIPRRGELTLPDGGYNPYCPTLVPALFATLFFRKGTLQINQDFGTSLFIVSMPISLLLCKLAEHARRDYGGVRGRESKRKEIRESRRVQRKI